MSVPLTSFLFDGVDMYDVYGVVITRRPWPHMPKPRVWRQPLADANGEVTAGRAFGAREFVFDCAVEDNAGDLQTTLEAIVTLFADAHTSGELKTIVFGYRPTEQYMVRIVDEIRFEAGLNGAEFTLSLVAPDPMPTTYEEGS